MPRIIVLLLVLLSSGLFSFGTASSATTPDLSAPGPHSAGSIEVTVPKTGGGTFAAALYYPATSTGTSAPFDSSSAPYPAVSFGHGFLQPVEQYASTLEHLATWGYFAIAPRSAGGLLPSHAQFASDLRDCLTWLETENAIAGSVFLANIDTNAFGLSGHSMGGGASILAAAEDQRVRALANLAAAETNPSAIAAMSSVNIPVRLITGGQDTITPPLQNGALMYANANAPRQIQTIIGGFHCGFTDDTFLFCDSGTITRAQQLAITRRLLTAFFNLHLKGDQTAWSASWGPEAVADNAAEFEADPGVAISAAQTLLQAPAGVVTTTVDVTNTGNAPASFTVLIEDAAWIANATPAGTVTLLPGATEVVEIAITVPAGGADQDTIQVTARRDDDHATRAFVTLTIAREQNCPCDWDASSLLNSDDFFAFLDDFFSGGPADFNNNGTTNSDDFFDFLTCFFTPPPAC